MVARSGFVGFTLIELLVVIAIILILIAVAIPNLLDALLRAKVTRAHGELRSVTIAMECYHRDFGFYPLRTRNASLPPETPSGLDNLTTPIGYMNPARLEDPFPEPPYYTHYRYWPIRPDGKVQANTPSAHNKDSSWYLLSSNGPECNFTPFAQEMRQEGGRHFLNSVYSPSNGSRSWGNIWRLGGLPDGVGRTTVVPFLPPISKS